MSSGHGRNGSTESANNSREDAPNSAADLSGTVDADVHHNEHGESSFLHSASSSEDLNSSLNFFVLSLFIFVFFVCYYLLHLQMRTT